jgi:hypothetical protein
MNETQELLVSLDEKQNELTEYQTNVVNIRKYASDLQTYLAVNVLSSCISFSTIILCALTAPELVSLFCLILPIISVISLINSSISLNTKSNSLNQTKLSCKIDNGLKTIATNIQKFGEIVVESRPCEMIIVRRKDKQAQMMVADLSPPVSVVC